jgi:hypothetical protein
MLGDRRGWLLLILQPVAIAAVAILAVAFIDGTRWLVVFPPIVALAVVWIGQAVDAHQRALKLGAKPGGELSIALLLPLAVGVLTVFWLLGGRHGSPSATLQAYIEAWVANRPDAASSLFAASRTNDEVAADWARWNATLGQRIAAGRAIYGPDSGLDPARPFDSLRFTKLPGDRGGDGRVGMSVDIVRSERVETTVLGIIPTASLQTVAVERDMTIWLQLVPEPQVSWLPFGSLQSSAWRISSVEESVAP